MTAFQHRLLITLALLVWDHAVVAAQPPTEPAFGAEGVAFLMAHCIECHGESKRKGDLSLHTYTDDISLLKDRKIWQRVREVVRDGEMPPEDRPKPTARAVEAFAKRVDAVFDRADRASGLDPGRVTMRRLNRAEYNNTVRDLCGIDFAPAADFPSDDVGHGFDNNGDVLTLPPLLLERYLAAAEAIVERAVMVDVPKPIDRPTAAEFLEPAGSKIPLVEGRFRKVSGKADGTSETGPLHASFPVVPGEEYIAGVRAYAETSGKGAVRLALLACCDPTASGVVDDAGAEALSGAQIKGLRPFLVLKVFEVKGRTPKTAQSFDVPLPRNIGATRLAVALVKPAEGEPAPALFVSKLTLRGPLDPRPVSHRTLLARDGAKPKAAQTREVLARFVSRAYRRPATADEVSRLAGVAEAAEASGDRWEVAVQKAMTCVLCSSKFLFRVELDDRPTGPEARPLDDYQLASRLSYFLWSSMPDDELFALAAKGQLGANLDSQVRRMLRDPKANALVEQFGMQWLQLQRLKTIQPDRTLFPSFTEPLRAAMWEETRRFLEAVVREDRSVLELLDADFTFLNAPLARHYGIADTAGNAVGADPKIKKPGGKPIARSSEWLRVDLKGTVRGGVLAQASVLAVTSNPSRTSPVKRGRWVLEQLLGAPPPPPPPNVPELEKDGKPTAGGTLRQRMEAHRASPACAGCHAKMDALGFGLENFDAVGAYRTEEGGAPIDSSGVLSGRSRFRGPSQLKAVLVAHKEEFARCLAEKLLAFAIGRGVDYRDRRAVGSIVDRLARGDYKFSALAGAVAASEPFRLRRGKDQP